MKSAAAARLESPAGHSSWASGSSLALLIGLLLSCSEGGGGSGGSADSCQVVTNLQLNSVTIGQLTQDDCTVKELFPGSGDKSFVDQYRINLTERRTLSIRMESTQLDSFVVLLDSPLELPAIAQDDNSGGGTDALIRVDLDIGEYIILANSALLTPVTGEYTLTIGSIWSPTSLVSPPEARYGHTAVWTGSEMIVWGGQGTVSGLKNTGARLNPLTNVWTPISTAGAPSPRSNHTAVWTGTEMIVWGGYGADGSWLPLDDGARYDPQTDTWQPVSSVGDPSGRWSHTAVWTGSEMIVWGGFSCIACSNAQLDTGDRYDPAADAWTPTSTTNAPAARGYHTAVWTGSRMIVWGGVDDATPGPPNLFASGGLYDPAADSWASMSLVNAPAPTRCHSAVWTGAEMIVFGGQTDISLACDLVSYGNGSRYDPNRDIWIPMTVAPVSPSFSGARSVWTGTELLTWFGSEVSGARYTPSLDVWNAISVVGAPERRQVGHSLVWTGSQMIVWGGRSGGALDTGGIYDPALDAAP